jgi:hypothetical protein
MKYEWFYKRIGKRVYRDKNPCNCRWCKEIFENGIIVKDEDHCRYLSMVANDLQLKYYDEKPH